MATNLLYYLLTGEILTDLTLPSKFSLSIVSSSIANTGGLRCCPSIFLCYAIQYASSKLAAKQISTLDALS